jgi:hypothetical protein
MGVWAAGPAPATQRKRACIAFALMLGSLAVAPLARADVVIPAAGSMSLDAGTTEAACTDLIVAGTLNLDSGAFVNLRDVIVQPGGVLNGDTGAIVLSRNFTVLPGGQYNADRSTVTYDTTCGSGRLPAPIPTPTLGSGMLIALSAMLATLTIFLMGRGRGRSRVATGAAVRSLP